MPKAADQQHQPATRRVGVRLAGSISFVCIVLFAINVLVGKAVVSLGWQAPFQLGDVAEFLLLVVAAIFFVITTLELEQR